MDWDGFRYSLEAYYIRSRAWGRTFGWLIGTALVAIGGLLAFVQNRNMVPPGELADFIQFTHTLLSNMGVPLIDWPIYAIAGLLLIIIVR